MAQWNDAARVSQQLRDEGWHDVAHNPQQDAARSRLQQAATAHLGAYDTYAGDSRQRNWGVDLAQQGVIGRPEFSAVNPHSDSRFAAQIASANEVSASAQAYAASVRALPAFDQGFGSVPVSQAANQYQPGNIPQQQSQQQQGSYAAPAQGNSYGAPAAGRQGPAR